MIYLIQHGNICNVHNFNCIDIIYDSYINDSLKECEQLRRSKCEPIHLKDIQLETKLPIQLDQFLASASNKEKLQKLSRVYFKILSKTPNLEIVVSGYLTNNKEIVKAEQYYRDETTILPNLNSYTEEADTLIIPHINNISLKNNTTAVVLSNDTYVCVLLLHYMNVFKKNGLKKILIRYGTGNTRRFIPVHKIYEKLGNSVSSVLLKAHVLTGCDLTSKIGTKERVLKACAEPFFTNV